MKIHNFSKRNFSPPLVNIGDNLRFSAPEISPNQENISLLLSYLRDAGLKDAYKLFKRLAIISPHYRLARNLNELTKLLLASKDKVVDVLVAGLTQVENDALADMEKLGIDILLLGVAHSLLNIRERQRFLDSFHDDFHLLKLKKFWTIDPEILTGLLQDK